MKKLLAILMLCCGCATSAHSIKASESCVLDINDCERAAVIIDQLMAKIETDRSWMSKADYQMVQSVILMYGLEAYNQCVNNARAHYNRCVESK